MESGKVLQHRQNEKFILFGNYLSERHDTQHRVVLLCVIMLSVAHLTEMLSITILSVVLLCVIMLSVALFNVMLSVTMLSVVML